MTDTVPATRPHLSDAALANIDGKLAPGNWAVTSVGDALGQPYDPNFSEGELFAVVDLDTDDGPFAEMATQTAADAVMTALNAGPTLVANVRFLRQLLADLLDVERFDRDCLPVSNDGSCGAHGWGGTAKDRPCPYMRATSYFAAAPRTVT